MPSTFDITKHMLMLFFEQLSHFPTINDRSSAVLAKAQFAEPLSLRG
jgi:hypothetical protein